MSNIDYREPGLYSIYKYHNKRNLWPNLYVIIILDIVKQTVLKKQGNSIYFFKIIETAEGGISGVKGDVISLAGGE